MSDQVKETSETSEAQPALTGKRANWTIAHKVDVEAGAITWNVKGAGEIKLDLALVHEENRKRAMLHGFVQRVSDAAAQGRDGKTGASATPQQKYEAMRRLVEHYQGGSAEWSPARTGDGGAKAPRVNPHKELLVRALVIHAPEKGAEVVAKFVSELKANQVTGLLISEELKVSVELAREQLAQEEKKIAEGVDAGELLKGL